MRTRWREYGCRAFHLEFWLLGQDIRHPSGNLLLEYGFQRVPSPNKADGSSRYSRHLPTGATLSIWGFGLVCAKPTLGAVYVNRYRVAPQYRRAPFGTASIFNPMQIPPGHVPKCGVAWDKARMLMSQGLEELAAYERWVERRFGRDYRRQQVPFAPELARDVSNPRIVLEEWAGSLREASRWQPPRAAVR